MPKRSKDREAAIEKLRSFTSDNQQVKEPIQYPVDIAQFLLEKVKKAQRGGQKSSFITRFEQEVLNKWKDKDASFAINSSFELMSDLKDASDSLVNNFKRMVTELIKSSKLNIINITFENLPELFPYKGPDRLINALVDRMASSTLKSLKLVNNALSKSDIKIVVAKLGENSKLENLEPVWKVVR